ncbi:MAG: FKBP-type peptidyl-prolyl cis-trans isomerase, partial [Pseudomonadales bacterium]|nr:FKBP-type peptidyl-prolyl cis-trans isomerase [Pseudomonadales bacterium]
AGEPISYLHGHGNILPALEESLLGKAAGDTLEVTLAPEQAYGIRHANAEQRIPLKHIAYRGKLQRGMVVSVQTEQGSRQVTVLKVGKFNVDVDTNHPLAGRVLNFAIEVLEVRVASEEEIAHGHAHGEGGHHH